MLLVVLTVAVALFIPKAVRDPASAALPTIARLGLSVALTAGLGSLLLTTLAPVIAGRPPDLGVLATMRTVVLSVTAIVLARLGRSESLREIRWLAYGAVAGGALKILFEDFSASRPATLFIALAVYGAALILIQRIGRATA
jgi:hypothetical protein